jgi:GT2 family glycosyltransferase
VASDPLISVVIATYRRPALLAICLQALARQSYARDRFEVIVVDDDGGLREDDVLGPLRGQPDIHLLQPGHQGVSGARNTGAAHARGAHLYFLDDDALPAPDYLAKLEARIERHPGALIVGPVGDANPANIWSAASQAQLDAVTSYYNRPGKQASFGTGGNMCVPAEPYHAIGGFDAGLQYGEDREFLDRWLRRGHAFIHAPELLVSHRHPTKLHDFWRRNRGYGRGAYSFALQRRAVGVAAPSVDWRFYRHLFGYAIATHQPRAGRVTLALLLARVAYSYGYWVARLQHDRNGHSPDRS